MGLSDVIRSGIAIARSITLDLHVDVIHKAWIGQDRFGNPSYKSTKRKALVDKKSGTIKTSSGQEVAYRTYLGFIEPIPPNGYSKRHSEPVDEQDVFILPDGTTGPIAAIDGFLDGGTGKPFYTQVYLS